MSRADKLVYLTPESVDTIRCVAKMLNGLADALDDQDEILGVLCSEGLVNHLPALPTRLRHVLTECLTDEASRSYHADRLYLAITASRPNVGEANSPDQEKVTSPE